MKAREAQRKTTATGGSRKLKLSKETLQDLTPSGKQRDIKGGFTDGCTQRRCLGGLVNPSGINNGG